MRTYFDIPYLENASDMQRLDVYLPNTDGDSADAHKAAAGDEFATGCGATGDKSAAGCCVSGGTILWFHGGGIEGGSRKDAVFAESVVKRGFAFISAEYRMYPDAHFPEFIEDAAAAVAWAVKNMPAYGAPGRLFVCGESAGAYLTMMLCMDQHYLADAGVEQAQIAGYISDSAQQFNHFNVLRELGMDSRIERIDDHAPIFFVRDGLTIRPLLLLYYNDDIKCRPEETRLMYASIQKLMPDAQVSIQELPGGHCCKCQDENGEYRFVSEMMKFIEG